MNQKYVPSVQKEINAICMDKYLKSILTRLVTFYWSMKTSMLMINKVNILTRIAMRMNKQIYYKSMNLRTIYLLIKLQIHQNPSFKTVLKIINLNLNNLSIQ